MIEARAVERQAGKSGRRGATDAVDLLNDPRRVFERVTLGPDVCHLVTD